METSALCSGPGEWSTCTDGFVLQPRASVATGWTEKQSGVMAFRYNYSDQIHLQGSVGVAEFGVQVELRCS